MEIYSYAVKQSPNNEELLAHLFISHVRLEDFKSQQSVALQMYKAQPKNAYYFWAVMSVVLQVFTYTYIQTIHAYSALQKAFLKTYFPTQLFFEKS